MYNNRFFYKAAFKKNKEKVFQQLYLEAFPSVAKMIRSMGGNLEDAKDVFQDALILFYEKTMQEDFEIKHSAKAYIAGIARFLWIGQSKGKMHQLFPGDLPDMSTQEDLWRQPQRLKASLLKYLEKAGQKCLKLLQAFYYQNMSMNEIAEQFEYSSARSATVQKYKCLEKIRNEVKENKHSYEEIFG